MHGWNENARITADNKVRLKYFGHKWQGSMVMATNPWLIILKKSQTMKCGREKNRLHSVFPEMRR